MKLYIRERLKSCPCKLKWKQRYIISKGVSYVFTYSADAEKADKYAGTAKEFFARIKIE